MRKKTVCFAVIGILKILDLNLNQIFIIMPLCIDDYL